MAEVNKSQPESPLDITLSKWSTVKAIIKAVNDKYGLTLDAHNYEDRLAFTNSNGLLALDIIDVNTGELAWAVIDSQSGKVVSEINETLDHPKAFVFNEVIKNFGIVVNSEKELEFLKDVRLDVRYNSGVVGGDKSYKLMTLLNNYTIGDGWTSNPSQGCTTAYFVLRYFGTGANAPGVYNFNTEAKCLAVVELMMYGEYQLHALVVR
jgi:hypothetical protein